ncbi:amino acid adenylation domain-containing protein [Sorangium sp. So ce362]|uniref:amino acid adenylation domain-containing protein n=1 Tax=Sorangium sp. So ce362 TaxID=3133303 RepID=UPI003F5F439C
MTFSLDQLLRQSAERTPDRPALRSAAGERTYRELDEAASAVAGFLVERGVRRQDRVGVYLHRGFDSMAAIYGILRAGAAYAPFDSAASESHLAAVARDADIRVVLSEPAKAPRLRKLLALGTPIETVVGGDDGGGLPVSAPSWSEVAAARPRSDIGVIEGDLSVLFYTSGTTGTPKGVAHSHRSMLSNVAWALDRFGVRETDRVSNVTSHHFDLSWFELFVTIAAGALLVQFPEDTVKFPASLAGALERERLTVWCSVPSLLVGLVQRGDLQARSLDTLRWVLFAGERFPVPHLRRLMELVPSPRFCNMYGTTETHIAAHYEIPPLPAGPPDVLPIGRACAHVNLEVVDPEGVPVPRGQEGELVVRGPSVMEGYWQLPERSERALRPVAFTPFGPQRCYHTGDLVAEQPDGDLEILGRADRRVKVRGHLLDLDEVERALLAHETVQEAAAFVLGEEGADADVVAVVAPKPDAAIEPPALRAHAASRLPAFAVPSTFAVEPMLPKTGSGKLDRRAVQEGHRARVGVAAAATEAPAAAREEGDDADPIRAFLRREAAAEGLDLDDDTDLFVVGVVDSLCALRMVAFLEGHHGIHIPNDRLAQENFQTIRAIRAMVELLR